MVTWLIEHGKVDLNALDRFGHSPLVEAKENGHDEIFNYLLGQGGRAKAQSSITVHLLCKACATGDIVEIKKVSNDNIIQFQNLNY